MTRLVKLNMKTRLKILLLACSLGLNAFIAAAQPYTVDRFTVACGGGTSIGGGYTITGTVGQSDASTPLTNGLYSVTGGFWLLPQAVQSTNAPTLAIAAATPGNAIISWSPAVPGFVLQETFDLSLSAWTASPSGDTNPVILPAALPLKFYRLFKP